MIQKYMTEKILCVLLYTVEISLIVNNKFYFTLETKFSE